MMGTLKAVVCAFFVCGMVHIKGHFLPLEKKSHQQMVRQVLGSHLGRTPAESRFIKAQ